MFMFIIGFLCAWTVGAFFAILFDNRGGSGIQLFDGWGVILLTLPALMVVLPIGFIYRLIKKKINK